MQIKSYSLARHRAGFALMTVMLFVGVALIVFASMLLWTSTNARITNRNNLFNQAEAAAESATEIPLAAMIRDFANQNLNSADSYKTNMPDTTGWPMQYQFSDLNGNVGKLSVAISGTAWVPLDGTFT